MAKSSAAVSIWKDGWRPGQADGQVTPARTASPPEPGPLAREESSRPGSHPPLLPSRPKPKALQDLGVPEIFLADLVMKQAFYLNQFTLGELSGRLKLPSSLVSPLVDYLKAEKYLEVRGPDPLKPASNGLGLTNRYALTEGGKKRAAQLLELDAYVGPAPVSLGDYWQQVQRQSFRGQRVTRDRLQQAFAGLVLTPDLLDKLGPALMSGKPLFLYGPPGNGKTTIALRLGEVWDDAVLIPYALYVEGCVIRVFDEITHKALNHTVSPDTDQRWVLCRRPVIIVGGELTLDMLDLAYNPNLKYYQAPLQLKANNGLFIVDDLGRQQLRPQELLNRWIIPLENRQDFLCLHTGQKFAIPFDQFLVFATNIEPRSLMDESFLRRLRAKVKVDHVSREQFVEIFRQVCLQHQLPFQDQVVEQLLSRYYEKRERPMNGCHPRDLVEHILDYCDFHDQPRKLTPELLEHACQIYFVD